MLTEEIMHFVEERDWLQYHTPRNLAAALSVEAGELLELFTWENPSFQDIERNPEMRARMEEEMADVMIYLLEMFCLLNSDPVEAVRRKMEVNARKYPVELARGRADKYGLAKERNVGGGGG
ncbi:MAG: nucleotide pyrophosphohydrolase [Thermoplasmata archaeon]|nr:nucleotide pyrophosphohydrolase [Thermoplasmata archaeon]